MPSRSTLPEHSRHYRMANTAFFFFPSQTYSLYVRNLEANLS
jgi:hypothetical protein